MKKSLLKLVKKGSKRGLAFFLVLTLVFSANVFSAIKTVYANEPVEVVEEETENNEVAESAKEVSEELSENEAEEEVPEAEEDSSEEVEKKDEEPEEEAETEESEEEVETEELVEEANAEEPEEEVETEESAEEIETEEPVEEAEAEEPEEEVETEESAEEIETEELVEEVNTEELEENELNKEVTNEEEVKADDINDEETKEEETIEEVKEETTVEEKKEDEVNAEEVKADEINEEETTLEETKEEVNTEETEENKTVETVAKEEVESKENVDNNEALLNELNATNDVVKEEINKNEVKTEKVLFGGIEHKTYTVTRNWAGDYETGKEGTDSSIGVDIYSNDTWSGMTLSGWLAETVDLQLGKPKRNDGVKFSRWDVHFDASGLVWNDTSGGGEIVDPADLEYVVDTDNEGNYSDMVGVPIDPKFEYVSGDFVITAEPVWIERKNYDVILDWGGSYATSPSKTDIQIDIYSDDYCDLMGDTLSGWLAETVDLQLGKPSKPGFEFKNWDLHFDASGLVWDNTEDSDVVDPADLECHESTDNEGNYSDLVGVPIDPKFEYVSGDLVVTAKPLWTKTYDVTLSWSGDYDITPSKTDVQVDFYSGDYCELMDDTLSGWLAETVELQLGKPKRDDGYRFVKWDVHFDASNLVWNDTSGGGEIVDPADLDSHIDTDNEGNYSDIVGVPIDPKFEHVSGDLVITAEPVWIKSKTYDVVLNWSGDYDITPSKTDVQVDIYSGDFSELMDDTLSGWFIENYELHLGKPKQEGFEFEKWIVYFKDDNIVWNPAQDPYTSDEETDNEGNVSGGSFGRSLDASVSYVSGDLEIIAEPQWTTGGPTTWTEEGHVIKNWDGDYEIPGTNDEIHFTFRSGYPDPINGWETDHFNFAFGKAKQDGFWLNGWDINWKDNTVWDPDQGPMEWNDFANDEGKSDGNRNRNLSGNSVYQSGSVVVTATPNWRKKIWGIALEDNGGAGGAGKIFEWHTKGIYPDEQCDAEPITSVAVPTKAGNKFLGYFKDGVKYIDENGGFTADFTFDAFNGDTPLKAEWSEVGATVYKIKLDSTNCSGDVEMLYKAEGGDIYSDEACTVVVTSVKKPTKSGYTFNGYWTQQNKKGKQCIDSKGTIKKEAFEDKDMTIYPAWTKNGGSKSSGGGGGGGSDSYVGGPKVDTGENPTQKGITSQVKAVPTQDTAKSIPVKTSDIPVLADNAQWKFNIDNTWSLALDKNNQDAKAVNGFYALVSNDANGQTQSKTYYFDEAGKMVTGWVKDAQGAMYFFENDKQANEGEMVVGWKDLGGEWYFFGGDGKMFANTITPDGCRVGADGKWQR